MATVCLLVAVLTLANCALFQGPVDLPRDLSSIERQLRLEFQAERTGFPQTAEEVQELTEQHQTLVFLTERDRWPIGSMNQATRDALRQFVEQGGRILLFGYAARLVHELGIEPVAPDRFYNHRWGDSSDTAMGQHYFGLRLVDEGLHSWAEKMLPMRDDAQAFLLGGGVVLQAQTCLWQTAPKNGIVLAQYASIRDGDVQPVRDAALVAWGHGTGRVLAYSNVPEPWRDEQGITHNANQFLRNAMRALGGADGGSIALCLDVQPRSVPLQKLPPLRERRMWCSPVPHWGWQVPVQFQRQRLQPVTPDLVMRQVVVPSQHAGATLLDLQLADRDRGYPLGWTADDTLARPASYWGADYASPWQATALRQLTRQVHDRGMRVLLNLDPEPSRGGSDADMLACARYFGRELLDARHHGQSALDGFGMASWFGDRDGKTEQVLRQYRPAAGLYQTSHELESLPGFVSAMNADHGRPRGLQGAGISAAWRDAYPPPLYAAAVLDARCWRPMPSIWRAGANGGGSYEDWLLTQMQDFVRPRLRTDGSGVGSAVLWRAHNPETLAPRTAEYVQGISLAPLRCAVAGHLTATGVDGFRDLQRRLYSQGDKVLQPGFGAESSAPATTPFLQNNHFRLLGSVGDLYYDSTGLAQFRDGRPGRKIAQGFCRSVWQGLRPTVAEVEGTLLNFFVGAPRGEGRYGRTLMLDQAEVGPGKFPARLAFDQAGVWPRQLSLRFSVDRGLHELLLAMRGVSGQGLLELRLDDQVLGLLPFDSEAGSITHRMPLPLAEPEKEDTKTGGRRRRTLSLRVLQGGELSFEALHMSRQPSLAATAAVPTEVRVGDRAGWRASLVEHTWAPMLDETRRLITLADLPGFALSIDYGHVEGGLQVVRQFGLSLHRNPTGRMLREPFVLRSSDRSIPGLAVIPLRLPRRHYFRVTSERGLELVGVPRSREVVRIGFLFLRDDGWSSAMQVAATRLFQEIFEPTMLRIGAVGRATVASPLTGEMQDKDLVLPRVVQVVQAKMAPFQVQEQGLWSFRGGQPSADGLGDWLLLLHRDRQPVQIHTGEQLAKLPRAAMGSQHCMLLEERTPQSVTVHLRQAGLFLPAPGVEFPQAFATVRINGEPWRYTHGRTVFLSRAPGRYRIEIDPLPDVGQQAAAAFAQPARQPALAETNALIWRCAYDPASGVLEVFTKADADPGRHYLAWFTGGEPVEVDGGEVLDERQLFWPDRAHRRSARRAGVIVRFRAGLLRLRYKPAANRTAPKGAGK